MKRLFLLMLAGWMLASCASQKRALYLQDLDMEQTMRLASDYQDKLIKLKPLDRITVIVNSDRPELAAPFNTTSSYNSLSGTPIDGTNLASSANSGAMQIRTIDREGFLEMPIIGNIYCAGKSRQEVADEIAAKIVEGGHLNSPTVNIQFADMMLTVLGEVKNPGRYQIVSDRVSVLDALAMAGDMTIYGQRNDVVVIREENGKRTSTELDLTSQEIFQSPYFYIQQNDVVYVKPNKYKAQTGEYNQNRSFYLSIVSTLVSVATLIVTLTR